MNARTWFWIAVTLFAGLVAWSARALPAQVPVHFGLGGEADRFASRSQAVFEASVIGSGVALVFSLTDLLVRRGPLSLVNVPHKAYWTTPEREPRLRQMIAHDTWVIGTLTMLLLIGVELQIVAVADQPDPRLGPWVWAMVAAYLVAVAGYAIFMQVTRYRPEER